MALSNQIVIACWIVFVLYWAISATQVKRTVYRRSPWRRIIGPGIVILAVLASGVPSLQGAIIRQGLVTGVVADVLCISGIAFAIWARRHLGRNWSGYPALKEDHELVTSGPYRIVRHPIYTGILMAMLATALVNDTLWLIAFALFCIMFVTRAREEEQLMLREFPDQYPAYRQRTKMLIPFLW